ncbi:MAG: hypothetical protein FJ044_00595 [Candidatus Cloacimonetes bacterium]|nr:hypothetical protein [Candidatus Cloacimonadota bacterium]
MTNGDKIKLMIILFDIDRTLVDTDKLKKENRESQKAKLRQGGQNAIN